MAELRTHLSSGKSSGEVIALGYKAGTVYKVQRQLYRRGQGEGSVAGPRSAQLRAPTVLLPWSEVEPEKIQLHQQVEELGDELKFGDDDDDELEAEVQTLRERVKVLEAEAVAAGLRQRVKDLEGQLERAGHTQVTMQQCAALWQRQAGVEQAARLETERKLNISEQKYDNCVIITP
jgi:uncharacterized protein (DUF2267 family)